MSVLLSFKASLPDKTCTFGRALYGLIKFTSVENVRSVYGCLKEFIATADQHEFVVPVYVQSLSIDLWVKLRCYANG